jgi:hypothetical protein
MEDSSCETCLAIHLGTYGSGRFCSSKCARGFSTKAKRKEINKTVSEKLRGTKQPPGKERSKLQQEVTRVLTSDIRQKALEYRKQCREIGASRVSNFDLFVVGCMLYWGEGTKNRSEFIFSNSDPQMISLYLRFLRESMKIQDSEIELEVRGYLNCSKSPQEVEEFWSSLSGISVVGTYELGTERKRDKLLYGTAHVFVKRGQKYVQQVYGAIEKIAGIKDSRKWT